MAIKNEIFHKKFQEVPNFDYLKKIKKEILKDEKKIKGVEFSLKSVIEVDTPLLHFLLSLKQYMTKQKKSFSLSNMPFSGDELMKLYDIKL